MENEKDITREDNTRKTKKEFNLAEFKKKHGLDIVEKRVMESNKKKELYKSWFGENWDR